MRQEVHLGSVDSQLLALQLQALTVLWGKKHSLDLDRRKQNILLHGLTPGEVAPQLLVDIVDIVLTTTESERHFRLLGHDTDVVKALERVKTSFTELLSSPAEVLPRRIRRLAENLKLCMHVENFLDKEVEAFLACFHRALHCFLVKPAHDDFHVARFAITAVVAREHHGTYLDGITVLIWRHTLRAEAYDGIDDVLLPCKREVVALDVLLDHPAGTFELQ